MRLAEIDTDALLQLVWAAPLAALTVALTFSLVIHGAARASDSRRAGRSTAATLYGALAVLAAVAFAASVVFGVLIITSKD
ncbi:MAG TPA: hypothetical protein VHF89_17945 [Solirubrobacteraceae bacterium]|nr:hypothetical protein [Solirubrobacteraceae bacterium]